ncbi:MAG: hypothetical protein ACR2JR_13930 [Rubrobacteraceae bacterium]
MFVKAALILLTWLAAFLIVMGLFVFFGEQLRLLPLPLRVLVLTGVLVILMSQVVMPGLNRMFASSLSRGERNPGKEARRR